MKSKFPLSLCLLLGAAPLLPAARAADATLSANATKDSPSANLAGQIEEIATSTTLSAKARMKMIASTVRLAIAAATEGVKEPARRLELALELVLAAVKSAPQFASTITAAALEVPEISGLEGGAQKIEAAVKIALESAEAPEIANPAPNRPRPPVSPEFGGANKGEVVVSPSA